VNGNQDMSETPTRVINPNAVYGVEEATEALGLPKLTIKAEIRKGRLRASRRARQYFILGEWLLEWLRDGEVARRRTAEPIAAEEEIR